MTQTTAPKQLTTEQIDALCDSIPELVTCPECCGNKNIRCDWCDDFREVGNPDHPSNMTTDEFVARYES